MRMAFLLTAASLMIAGQTSADQGRVFQGSSDQLVHAGSTTFGDDITKPSLCIQVRDHDALLVPIARVASGDAFSDTGCPTMDATPVTAASVEGVKRAGVLPETTPTIPVAPLPWTRERTVGTALAVILAVSLPWFVTRRRQRRTRAARMVSGDPLYFDTLLSVMFHVARTDGVVTKDDLAAIRRTYSLITGGTVTPEMTASHFARFVSTETLLSRVAAYRNAEAEMLLDVAVMVAAHSGCIPREKRGLLTALNAALDSDKAAFEERIQMALCPKMRAARGIETVAR